MFSLFKKKSTKDQYLLKVATILHENIGQTLPLENAYNLAEECLKELRAHISNGNFHDGPNPKEIIMAYYSMCSMISEASRANDEAIVVNKLSLKASFLNGKLGAFENMTPLEKGIWQFGWQVLEGVLNPPSEDEIAKIKSDTVQIIMELMKDQEATVYERDVKTIVENVSANLGELELSKAGERVLAVSVLSNATGYYIDQNENDVAYSYFMCVGAAIRKHFAEHLECCSEYQQNALRVIMEDYRSLGEELKTY